MIGKILVCVGVCVCNWQKKRRNYCKRKYFSCWNNILAWISRTKNMKLRFFWFKKTRWKQTETIQPPHKTFCWWKQNKQKQYNHHTKHFADFDTFNIYCVKWQNLLTAKSYFPLSVNADVPLSNCILNYIAHIPYKVYMHPDLTARADAMNSPGDQVIMVQLWIGH